MAYIYRHVRLDKNEPFYVGIGSDIDYVRAYSTINRNKHWNNIINLTPYEVEIILEDLTWDEACQKEQEFIKIYGRKDLRLGSLCNLTEGGEGQYGRIASEETCNKISNSKKGMVSVTLGKTWKCKAPVSEETKKKIYTLERNKKIGINQRKSVLQYDLQGNFIKKWESVTEARKETKISKIDKVARGEGKTAGKFIWKYKD
jgi:hypothetical protein